MHRSWNSCFPFPWGMARHSEASCWPPVGMKSHRTPLNVCAHHGARCRVNDSKLKIKKRFFFHHFYVSVIVFVLYVLTDVQKYTQLAFLLCSNPWCLTGPILNFGCFPIFTYGKITDDYSLKITEKSTCIHHFYEYRLHIVTLHTGGSPPSIWKCPPVMCCYWSH